MELTTWEAKQYLNVHKQLPATTVDEMRMLLDLQDKLTEGIESEEDFEVDDNLMKRGYNTLKNYKPKWEQDKKVLALLEKLESL